jgi:hypothetical protein
MKMTAEHKAAMKAGRNAAKINSNPEKVNASNEFEAETLRRAALYAPSAKNAFVKAFSGKSKALAIKSKCIECCAYQKAEVTACNVKGCPLWRYRPYQGKGGE